MSTDNVRKFIEKYEFILQWLVNHLPCFYFNKSLNCLIVSFYDCSYVSKPVLFKSHFLDLHFNQHPRFKWLSLSGFTFWFPYTWEQIKEKTCCKLPGSDIEEYIELNKSISREFKALKKEATDLIYYADMCAKILKDNGWPGKAEALERRYLVLGKRLGLKPDGPNSKEPKVNNQPPLEEEPK